MAEVRALVRAGGDVEPRELKFCINGDEPDFVIRTEPFAEWGLGPVEDRLLDLLDIAGAIFAVDGQVTRGGLSRPNFGDRWRRTADMVIDVREPAFWGQAAIRDALTEAVGFLTDDAWSFTFRKCAAEAPKHDYLDFSGPSSAEPDAETVLLFSGGLDSLAGAIETLEREPGRVVLVTHRSANKIISRQDKLAAHLRQRYGSRVAYVPIRANLKNRPAPERTQRSRSFLFAAFGYVIANISGAKRLHFWENGVVSQNLPFSPQIIGTMATRTTHPLVLRKFEDLFNLVGGSRFEVRNEYEWLTKKEVIQKLQANDAADLIETAVSCNEVIKRTVEHTHCGACSQCLDRRFGILAAGLGKHEPDAIYETPVLTGARQGPRSKIMALEWTRHAVRLSTAEPTEFLERFGSELDRIARGYPDLSASEVMRRSLALHKRHGEAVTQVLVEERKRLSLQDPTGKLPPTCLLIAWMTDDPDPDALPRLGRGAEALDDQLSIASPDDDEGDGLYVTLVQSGSRRFFEVRDLGTVFGAPAGPVFALHPLHDGDRRSGLAKEEFRFVLGSRLIPEGGRSKSAVAQNIKRCRKLLAEFYQETYGERPKDDLLIQTKRGWGYRLDPTATLVRTDEAHRRAAVK